MTWFLLLTVCYAKTCSPVVLPARYEAKAQCSDAGAYAVETKLAASYKCIPTTRPK